MDWFEQLTGFEERTYANAKANLRFRGGELFSTGNQQRFDLGQFEICRLHNLRTRTKNFESSTSATRNESKLIEKAIYEDAYQLHCCSEANRAVVQVASQFNLLEMASPQVGPEDGVTRYQNDHTQGPACAMAAGPATLYRNYGIRIGSQQGQTNSKQVNTLEDLVHVLEIQNIEMKNGYAMIETNGLKNVSKKLTRMTEAQREDIKGQLKVGVHWDTTVTATGAPTGQKVTQVFCSALPIAYNREDSSDLWEPFARLVLEACYEATLLIAMLNHEITGNPRVYLTRVGGGVFGNKAEWIDDAIEIALAKVADLPLKVVHVKRKLNIDWKET